MIWNLFASHGKLHYMTNSYNNVRIDTPLYPVYKVSLAVRFLEDVLVFNYLISNKYNWTFKLYNWTFKLYNWTFTLFWAINMHVVQWRHWVWITSLIFHFNGHQYRYIEEIISDCLPKLTLWVVGSIHEHLSHYYCALIYIFLFPYVIFNFLSGF